MVFVLLLKFERINRRLSQHQVATIARIAQPALSQIETGRLAPTPAQLQRLAALFHVAPSELLKDVVVLRPSR
ncbi:MAG: helix-turn-helix transcriptional regulator [Acidimicrobiia bacterium]|nr:helix-turn-helix transcriptional regulator [Acidimicrobiia bacterium]